jgi:hypothetical protein
MLWWDTLWFILNKKTAAVLLAFVSKALNMLSILKCNNYVLAIGLFRAFPSNKFFPLDGIIPSSMTQTLLFIPLTKPSMTTLPSSSSKVKPCFLFEWYSHYFILFVPIWTKEWISTATLNVANGSHGNTLTEVDSLFIFIDKETLSFRSEGISYIIKLILLVVKAVSCWLDKDVQLRKQTNGLSSSHFHFQFQSVYKYQPCSLRSQLGW